MKRVFYLILFTAILAFSCNKDEDVIPYVSVNIYIDVNSSVYNDINAVGGHMYLIGGYKGIILYRMSFDEFVAIERACPYRPSVDCERLTVEPNGLALVDSCCGSRFLITDGSVVNGPAKRPAVTYKTIFDGNMLYIYN